MLRDMPMLGAVRLAPIPASVLPSAMAYRAMVESEHGDEWGEAVTVTGVRFARTAEFSADRYQFREGSRGLVFVDALNSAADGPLEVPEGAEVTVDGGEPMEAVRVTRFDHFDGTPHHWEVEVR